MKYDSSAPPLVQMKKISCLNDGNKVLRNLSLTLYPGQIHAVVGDHGSGKSYISDVLSGIHPVHSGELYLEGRKVNPLSIKKSQDFGIQTVHQDVSLIQNFNLAENLFTPELPDQSFPFQKSKRLQIAEEILKGYGVYISPEKLYKDLNLSEKILINIIRVLLRSPRLLILDEALEKLTGRDYECLINILNGHIDRGMSILCLSHKIDEVYNFADSVSIIRKGEIFLNDSMDSIDRLNLVKLCYSQLNYDSNINDLSKEFYQLLKYNEAILQKLPINLIVTDDSGRIKMINDAGRKFFNLHAREFRDKSLRELFLEEKEGFIHALEDALAGQTETSLYNMRLTMSSSKRIVNFRTLPIYDGAFLIGNIIILEDISEQEKLREQINLSEKLASVGLLAAGVAHEINNPLEIIFNHLNYLDMKSETSEQREVIGEIVEELRDIKSIVSNLISFSDSKKAALEEFDMNDLVSSLINLIRFNARSKNIDIIHRKNAENLLIRGSKNEMKQVLLNLLKNSFEAMPEGGTIKISTDCLAVPESPAGHVEVLIDDNGPGLSDDSGDIFLPFYTTKKGSENNLGLGLSVIYGIIKKYRGEIHASNRAEGGCRFRIRIPSSPG